MAGSSRTFSRVVSTGACSVTSNAWRGASMTGCSWAASATSVGVIVSAGASIATTGSSTGAASMLMIGSSATGSAIIASGAASVIISTASG